MKTTTLKWLLALLTIFAFAFTLVWIYKAPSFEPVIALLTIIATGVTLITSEWKNPENGLKISERRILQSVSALGFGVSIAWLVFEFSYTSVSGLLTSLLTLGTSFLASDTPLPTSDFLREFRSKSNRRTLIKSVRDIWLGDTLKTDSLMPLHIRLMDGFSSKKSKSHLLNRNIDIMSVYRASKGNLLIVGEAGIGKTVALSQLVSDLLTSAEKNSQNSVPVLFSLATWGEKSSSLEEWLLDEMAKPSLYNVSKSLGQAWLIDGKQLSLFLDGLDDVPFEKREDCVDAIGKFQIAHPDTSITLCCRSDDEYQNLITRLNVNAIVEILPLTEKDVLSYIKTQLNDKKDARGIVNIDSELLDLVRNRLMLALLCENLSVLHRLRKTKSSNVKEQKHELINAYIEDSLERKGDFTSFKHELILEWLQWLASKMTKSEQKTLLVERLQPDWLPTPRARIIFKTTTILVLIIGWVLFGILIGESSVGMVVLWGLIVYPSRLQPQAIPAGLAMSLNWGFVGVIGTIFVVPFVLYFKKITPVETFRFSSKNALKGLLIGSIAGGICSFVSFRIGKYAAGMSVFDFSGEDIIKSFFFTAILGALIMLIGIATTIILYMADAFVRKIKIDEEGFRIWGIIGMIIGLSCGVFAVLIPIIEINFRVTTSYPEIFMGMIFLGGLIGFFVHGITIMLYEITERKRLMPNHGIRQSIKSSLLATVIGIILALTIGWLLSSMVSANIPARSKDDIFLLALFMVTTLFFAVLLPPALGMIYGGMAFVEHYVLRLILAVGKYVPFRFVRFLEDARKLGFIKKVGGGYEFRHNLFLDYFANFSQGQSITLSKQETMGVEK